MNLNLEMVCDIITVVSCLDRGKFSLEELHTKTELSKYERDELLKTLDRMIFLRLLSGERMDKHEYKNVIITSLTLYGHEISDALSSTFKRLELNAFLKSNPDATVVDLHEKARLLTK